MQDRLEMAISQLVSAHQLIDSIWRDVIDEPAKDLLLDAMDDIDDLISRLEDYTL